MEAETVATIDLIFKVIVIGGLLAVLIKVFTLDGAFGLFINNHWPHFVAKFDDTSKKVWELDNRVQRLEDDKDK